MQAAPEDTKPARKAAAAAAAVTEEEVDIKEKDEKVKY
jgi:hypothetical protein